MVRLILVVFMTCWSLLSFAQDVSAHAMRQLLDQQIILARHSIQLTASLESRQVFQQEQLIIHIKTTSPRALGKLVTHLRTTEQQDWSSPQLSFLQTAETEQGLLHEWSIVLFAKHTGVLQLPSMQLQFIGDSMAQKWVQLPSLSIRVLPLPAYLPTEVLVGKGIALVAQKSSNSWLDEQFNLVGDLQQRQISVKLDGVQENSLYLPSIAGEAVKGLSPVMQIDSNQVKFTQAWQVTTAGAWQVADQHIWLFNPETLVTTHLVIAGQSGYAIPVWLWRVLQLIVLLIFLGLLFILFRVFLQRFRQYRHRQAILACNDAHQLLNYLKRFYGYPKNSVLSHCLSKVDPHYDDIITIEGMLFGDNVLLYGKSFELLKLSLVN